MKISLKVHSRTFHLSYKNPSLKYSNVESERLSNHTREDFISSDITSYLILYQELTDIQKNTDLCMFVVMGK